MTVRVVESRRRSGLLTRYSELSYSEPVFSVVVLAGEVTAPDGQHESASRAVAPAVAALSGRSRR